MADETTPVTEPKTLTRGQKAAKTREANRNKKAAAAKEKKPLPLSYLQDVLSSLDEAGQALQAYAGIKSASVVLVVPHEGSEYTVTAAHNGADWVLENVRF